MNGEAGGWALVYYLLTGQSSTATLLTSRRRQNVDDVSADCAHWHRLVVCEALSLVERQADLSDRDTAASECAGGAICIDLVVCCGALCIDCEVLCFARSSSNCDTTAT